jgi:hypothetical protein
MPILRSLDKNLSLRIKTSDSKYKIHRYTYSRYIHEGVTRFPRYSSDNI